MTPRLNNNIYSAPLCCPNSSPLDTRVSITQRATTADGIPRRGPVVSEPRGSVVKASGCKGARRLDLEAQLNLNLQQLEVAASVCPTSCRAHWFIAKANTGTQFACWFLFRVARPSGGGGGGVFHEVGVKEEMAPQGG